MHHPMHPNHCSLAPASNQVPERAQLVQCGASLPRKTCMSGNCDPRAIQSETGVIPWLGQHTNSYQITTLQDQLTVWSRTTDWKSLGHRDQSTKSFSAL